jgi:hypothetical protein
MSGIMAGPNQDFALWTRAQAAALRAQARAGTNLAIDWEHVAEEIEDLGRSERRELASRIGTILEHLLKLIASPAELPRGGWEATVLRERAQVADLLAESPSLRQEVPAIIARRLPLARRIVARELAAYGEVPADPPELDEARVLGEWLP